MMKCIDVFGPPFIAIIIVFASMWYALGYHIVYAPTPDQLYGCTVAQQAPNGECK